MAEESFPSIYPPSIVDVFSVSGRDTPSCASSLSSADPDSPRGRTHHEKSTATDNNGRPPHHLELTFDKTIDTTDTTSSGPHKTNDAPFDEADKTTTPNNHEDSSASMSPLAMRPSYVDPRVSSLSMPNIPSEQPFYRSSSGEHSFTLEPLSLRRKSTLPFEDECDHDVVVVLDNNNDKDDDDPSVPHDEERIVIIPDIPKWDMHVTRIDEAAPMDEVSLDGKAPIDEILMEKAASMDHDDDDDSQPMDELQQQQQPEMPSLQTSAETSSSSAASSSFLNPLETTMLKSNGAAPMDEPEQPMDEPMPEQQLQQTLTTTSSLNRPKMPKQQSGITPTTTGGANDEQQDENFEIEVTLSQVVQSQEVIFLGDVDSDDAKSDGDEHTTPSQVAAISNKEPSVEIVEVNNAVSDTLGGEEQETKVKQEENSTKSSEKQDDDSGKDAVLEQLQMTMSGEETEPIDPNDPNIPVPDESLNQERETGLEQGNLPEATVKSADGEESDAMPDNFTLSEQPPAIDELHQQSHQLQESSPTVSEEADTSSPILRELSWMAEPSLADSTSQSSEDKDSNAMRSNVEIGITLSEEEEEVIFENDDNSTESSQKDEVDLIVRALNQTPIALSDTNKEVDVKAAGYITPPYARGEGHVNNHSKDFEELSVVSDDEGAECRVEPYILLSTMLDLKRKESAGQTGLSMPPSYRLGEEDEITLKINNTSPRAPHHNSLMKIFDPKGIAFLGAEALATVGNELQNLIVGNEYTQAPAITASQIHGDSTWAWHEDGQSHEDLTEKEIVPGTESSPICVERTLAKEKPMAIERVESSANKSARSTESMTKSPVRQSKSDPPAQHAPGSPDSERQGSPKQAATEGWWLEQEIARREELRQSQGPLDVAAKIAALNDARGRIPTASVPSPEESNAVNIEEMDQTPPPPPLDKQDTTNPTTTSSTISDSSCDVRYVLKEKDNDNDNDNDNEPSLPSDTQSPAGASDDTFPRDLIASTPANSTDEEKPPALEKAGEGENLEKEMPILTPGLKKTEDASLQPAVERTEQSTPSFGAMAEGTVTESPAISVSEPPSLRRPVQSSEQLTPIPATDQASQGIAKDSPALTISEPPSLRRAARSSEWNGPKAGTEAGEDVATNSELAAPPSLLRVSNNREEEKSLDNILLAEGELPSIQVSVGLSTSGDGAVENQQPRPRTSTPSDDSHSSCDLISKIDAFSKALESPATGSWPIEQTESKDSVSAANSAVHESRGTDPEPISGGKPLLVSSFDNDIGIPKGDIVMSLLNSKSESTWASRVDESIWRCRRMRQNCDTKWLKGKLSRKPGTPSRGRTSIPIDVDDARVEGGLTNVSSAQKAAVEHLKYDDFEDALMLLEDITRNYYYYFEGTVQDGSQVSGDVVSTFKSYIGAAFHNLGVVHLLRGEHLRALNYFERATVNRASCPGVGHSDHLASLVKMAICRFALGELAEAQSALGEALSLAREKLGRISDYRQLAEILNNLGCLFYVAGQREQAMKVFLDSLEVHSEAAEFSLYAGSRFSCHSSSINMSVTKANIGFLALAERDITLSISSLEVALKDQALLLRGADATLISTMDYLVVANIVEGRKKKALQMLRRMMHMQVDEFGPDDFRCLVTKNKISLLEQQDEVTEKLEEALSKIPKSVAKAKRTKYVLNVFKRKKNKA